MNATRYPQSGRRIVVSALCVALSVAMQLMTPSARAQSAAQAQSVRQYDIPAGPLAGALSAWGAQSGRQLVFPPELVTGKRASAVSGRYGDGDALTALLKGSGLEWSLLDGGTIAIRKAAAGTNAASVRKPLSRRAAATEQDERVVGMPAIMVQGARTLNMDITRTEDDPQPYVVFDRDIIERSGATTLEQFLQQRLPMNTSVASMGGAVNTNNYRPSPSSINLRGLGASQTLILVDGHRMSSPSVAGDMTQGEISGIPLAAVERIEILPSTASGIYGGSATGGVINIITRKDYSGGEVRLTYDNTFSSDSAIRKLDFVFGHHFNEGRTSLLLSGSYSDANELTEADRGFVQRGRDRIESGDFGRSWMTYGRLPNFRSTDGSDLVLKSGAALGASFGTVPAGYAGIASDGGQALVQGAGRFDWDLPAGSSGARRVLYTEPTLKNGGLVLRHEFSEGLQGFIDLSSSEARRVHQEGNSLQVWDTLSADSPYNPFTTAVDIAINSPVSAGLPAHWSTTKHDRAVAGLVKRLGADWQMSLDYTWDRTRLDYSMADPINAFVNAFYSGTVDIGQRLRDFTAYPISGVLEQGDPERPWILGSTQSTMRDANLRVSGPLGDLPAGRPVLSAALAHRDESAITDEQWTWGSTTLYPERSISASSLYLEYRVPLFSELNARHGIRELELQVAARYEDYISRSTSTVSIATGNAGPVPEPRSRVRNQFSSVDPTIALRWKPVDSLALRLSYGTGFVPPSLSQILATSSVVDLSWLSDPLRGNTPLGQVEFFSAPDLKPESSESWSGGLIFTPATVPGLRLSVDYTRIKKTDNIGKHPRGQQGLLNDESLFPGFIIRGDRLPGDPAGWAGPVVGFNNSPVNLASLKLEAWDVQLDYRLETESRGSFDFYMVGTWQPTYAVQLLSTAAMVDYAGVGSHNPLEFKANAGLTWSMSAWRAGWNVNHFDGYDLALLAGGDPSAIVDAIAAQGSASVASQTYHDVFASYDFGLSGAANLPAWLAGTQVQLGVRNVFNKRPPLDMYMVSGHAYYSAFGSPRLASYYLTLVKRF